MVGKFLAKNRDDTQSLLIDVFVFPPLKYTLDKTIYLMRHAESESQASKKNGIERTDKSLLDCRIT